MARFFIISACTQSVPILREAIAQISPLPVVEVFPSGEAIITELYRWDRDRPNIMFVDTSGVPDSDRIIEWIKLSSSSNTIPVVALVDENVPLPVGEQLITATLTKPFSVEDVIKTLKAISGGTPNSPPASGSQGAEAAQVRKNPSSS